MEKLKINSSFCKMMGDTVTPVSLYLKLRDIYPKSLLLESSDYHSKENSYSFICLNPLLSFSIDHNQLTIERHFDKQIQTSPFDGDFARAAEDFIQSLDIDAADHIESFNGLYGYMAYNSIGYFENIELKAPKSDSSKIPSIYFSFFKNIIAINHFKNEMTVVENTIEGQSGNLDKLLSQINYQGFASMPFKSKGEEKSNISDQDFLDMVEKGKWHCKRGDVFQIVLSRQFSQGFDGDDFNVYRALRSVNPSPYLFYFDYGSFHLLGSSPEAQIKVENNIALINPIAGTFKRTGNDEEDQKLALKLSADEKENAEHVMLVDLARNDLSKNCRNVKVQTFKEVQYFSHVIHLVSTVTGKLKNGPLKVVESTFPAGTLSGAPKYRAMQLIDEFENQDRGFYGGAVGYIGLDRQINLAIAIRSFVSKDSTLYFQAGAGVVEKSNSQSELQEVNNKLSALKKAIVLAENIN